MIYRTLLCGLFLSMIPARGQDFPEAAHNAIALAGKTMTILFAIGLLAVPVRFI